MGKLELVLHRAGISYNEYLRLREQFQDNKLENIGRASQILDLKKQIRIKESLASIDPFVQEMSRLNISYIDASEPDFPDILAKIPNPCYLIYYKGDIGLLKEFSIGMIGSRKPTAYGKYVANLFGSELAKKGVIVTSGFANGIDSESHRAAVAAKGKTVAVLGTTLANIYPKSNTAFARELVDSGSLIISEYPHDMDTLPHHFVERNRLISALSEGLLVVEAGEKSGTLTTVDHALEQGKNVFAVPGNINSANSYGTNRLIQFGAKPVTSVQDILEEYPFHIFREENAISHSLSGEEKIVMDVLKENGVLTSEEIAFFTKININYIIGILSVLEIKELVRDLGNHSYMLA